jgi:hypothetical protein
MAKMLMITRACSHTSYPKLGAKKLADSELRSTLECTVRTNESSSTTTTACSADSASPPPPLLVSFTGGDENQFARTYYTLASWFQHANSFLVAFCNKVR